MRLKKTSIKNTHPKRQKNKKEAKTTQIKSMRN